MKGICASHEERIVKRNSLHEEVAAEEVPPVKFYLMRHFPDFENPMKPLVHDITMSIVTDVNIANAWEGDAAIRFMDSPFEEVANLGPVRANGGIPSAWASLYQGELCSTTTSSLAFVFLMIRRPVLLITQLLKSFLAYPKIVGHLVHHSDLDLFL